MDLRSRHAHICVNVQLGHHVTKPAKLPAVHSHNCGFEFATMVAQLKMPNSVQGRRVREQEEIVLVISAMVMEQVVFTSIRTLVIGQGSPPECPRCQQVMIARPAVDRYGDGAVWCDGFDVRGDSCSRTLKGSDWVWSCRRHRTTCVPAGFSGTTTPQLWFESSRDYCIKHVPGDAFALAKPADGAADCEVASGGITRWGILIPWHSLVLDIVVLDNEYSGERVDLLSIREIPLDKVKKCCGASEAYYAKVYDAEGLRLVISCVRLCTPVQSGPSPAQTPRSDVFVVARRTPQTSARCTCC